MLKFISVSINWIRQVLATVSHVWQDARVPLIARILLILAPLYWLCPLDLNPDFLPGGFFDDLSIVPVLIANALFFIPRVVFRDAKRAAACGMLCLTVSGAVSCQTAIAAGPAERRSDQHLLIAIQSARTEASHANLQSAGTREKVVAVVNVYAKNVESSCLRKVDSLRNRLKPPAIKPATELASGQRTEFLTRRGGQYQLYSLGEIPASNFAAHSFYSQQMPPLNLAGGIFDVRDCRRSLIEGGRC